MAKRLIKNIVGIVFVPVIFSVTKSFYLELVNIQTLTEALKFFLSGFIAYAVMYIVFFKMDYLYVLGHEFVHALCVWIFGGRILSFKVKKTGGSITATKSNIFIDLVPYFLPIYTILISLIYFIGSSFWQLDSYLGYFVFFTGFSFSFHIVMTIDKMKIEQPDFLRLGYLNSLVLIYFVNMVIISLLLGFLLPEFSFGSFFGSFFTNTKGLYISIFNQLFSA